MKGYIETTIPQRQFENIKTHYEFTDEKGRKEAIKQAQQDCIELRHTVSHATIEGQVPDMEEKEILIGGVKWMNKKGTWKFYNEETKKWEGK